MLCDWENRMLQFDQRGHRIRLQGVPPPSPLLQDELSVEQFIKWQQGNEIWGLAVVQETSSSVPELLAAAVVSVLDEFHDVFAEPHGLTPPRVYDHTITLHRGAALQCSPVPLLSLAQDRDRAPSVSDVS